ncbi:MAG: RluA family pseudouridine synthase [Candidatus Wallbacteria bacterium]|nr:RluA family pseudouridine synthase [Candidatus Wallbacteria bacterium]
MAQYILHVQEEFHGRTLLEFLNASLRDFLKGTIDRLIREGCVEVEGKKLTGDWRLLKGLEVRVVIPEGFDSPATPRPMPLEILLEDDCLIAVNKPPGYSTTPGYGQERVSLLEGVWHHLREANIKPRIVNRLDKDTSGVLVFAKDDRSHAFLGSQFEQRIVEKLYLALVSGEMADDSGVVELPIAQHPRRPARMLINMKEGKEAVTRWRVAERFTGFTLLEVRPKTGRTHQIRVHLSAIGHPLAIDPLYGSKHPLMLSELKPDYRPRQTREERPLIGRLPLHAAELTFRHPSTGQAMTLVAPMPKDFRSILRALRRYRGNGG